MIIEDKASGQSVIQDLLIETNINIIKYKPKLDKITRFAAAVPYFENGRILIPSSGTWLQDLKSELIAFPNSRHDDMVDSISQFIDVMKFRRKETPRARML
jgi:predicted phage terminase large subunit-like protein